uniref:Unannotated protein n=1 Tax=freshwater metagenome TaxID=449393 RepID=A0A6J7NUJ3_9ZZZZ
MNALVVAGVPLHGHIADLTLFVVGCLEVGDLDEQRLFRGVEVLDEVDDATLVEIGDLLFLAGPLVRKSDLQTAVEERHRLQAFEHGAGHELRTLRCENASIRPKLHGGP